LLRYESQYLLSQYCLVPQSCRYLVQVLPERRSPCFTLADQDANELQGFANDIRGALQIFKTSADVQQMIHQFGKPHLKNSTSSLALRGLGTTRSDQALHHVVSRAPELRLSIRHWMDCPSSDDNVESIYWTSGHWEVHDCMYHR